MKTKFIAIASISVTMLSCNQTAETVETTNPEKPDTTSELIVEPQAPLTGFEADWENFKTSVSTNNWNEFKIFIGEDVTDPENLLTMLQEEWVLTPLTETTYDQLKASDYNGTPVKEFVAEVSGSDDEGNIYESAVFLYFEETETGLKLVNVLMAG